MTSPPASPSPTPLSPQEFDDALSGAFGPYVLALPVETRSALVKAMLRFLVDFRHDYRTNPGFLEAAAAMESQLRTVSLNAPTPTAKGVRWHVPD